MWILSAIANAIGSTFIGSSNYLNLLFEKRVKDDGGVFEASSCLTQQLNSLQNIYTLTTDPDAQAFVSAAALTDETQIIAINTLVEGLKTDGIWSKMKAVYPFVTDNRNLISYSEDFSNAYWTKTGSVITSNTTTAPDGTLTADSLTDNTTNGGHYIRTSATAFGQNGNNTSTIYAKANTLNYLWMYFYNGSEPAGVSAWFDLSNGTVGTVQSGLTASIESVGNGWYRCSITRNFNFTVANSNCGYGVSNADNVSSYIGANKSVYIWGAQLDLGSTATTYQPIATTQQSYISSQFKYNLVNPVDSDAAFRLVFNGGWTHSAQGATPNGTNGYADTKLVPSSVLSLNSTHLSFYSRTNQATATNAEMGAFDSSLGIPVVLLAIKSNSIAAGDFYDLRHCYLNDINLKTTSPTNTQGYALNTKSNSSTTKGFWNNSLLASVTSTNSLTNKAIFIGSRNADGTANNFSAKQCAFATIGDGLTDTEAANLYNRVQAFQTALNRQV